MAKEQEFSKSIKALQDLTHADTYGIDRSILEKNEKVVKDANQSVISIMSKYGGYETSTKGTNPIEELSLIVRRSIRTDTLHKTTFINEGMNDDSGFRNISHMGSLDSSELEMINSNSIIFNNYFALVPEYNNVVKLIPEVDRVIKIISRDVLNPSELTKRSFNHVYNANKDLDIDEAQASRINKLIIDEIIEPNKLEKKFKNWVYSAAVTGVKPIAIFPYTQINNQLESINMENKETKLRKFHKSIESGSMGSIFENDKDEQSFFNNYGYESSITQLPNNDTLYEEILDDSLIDDYFETCKHNAIESTEAYFENKSEIVNIFSQESTISETLEYQKNEYSEWRKSVESIDVTERRTKLRDKLKSLVNYIDDSILVVKPEASMISEAQKVLRKKDRYDALKTLDKQVARSPDEFLQYNKREKLKREDKDLNFKSDILEDALIVEYQPDTIIPISVGGQYVGFYAMEYEALYGPEWKSRRKTTSFTDFISATGYGSDNDMVTGVGPLVTSNAKDPIESNAFSPVSLFNYNVSKYVSHGANQDDARTEVLKTIVLKTLSRKLKDPELADNKAFKDAIMSLLRNDYLLKKQMQFTFIPPENMVYMTYDEDEDGVPKSIMDGALFFAYMYLSSIISSLMIKLLKSADKEKLEVNIGLSKDIGMSIAEIQRNLSTRTIHSQSLFNNLSTVLRNSSVYQRVIIPVIKDQKLYDVTPLERTNNLDPDDEFTERLLNSVLSKIGAPPSIVSIIEDADFARTIMNRNMEYRNTIIEEQSKFEVYAKKIITLLVKYSSLPKYIYEYTSKEQEVDDKNQNRKDDEFDIRIKLENIDPHFSPPNYITMTTVTDTLTAASTTIDEIVKAYDIDSLTGGVGEQVAKTFKKEMYKELVNNVDWDIVENILNQAITSAPTQYAQSKRFEKITDGIDNPVEPEPSSSDETGGGGDEFGGGGEDEFGGEF